MQGERYARTQCCHRPGGFVDRPRQAQTGDRRPYGEVGRGRGEAGPVTVESGSVRRRRTMSSEWDLGRRAPPPLEVRRPATASGRSPGLDISAVNVPKPNLGSQPSSIAKNFTSGYCFLAQAMISFATESGTV
jgi:hypothetical protein